MLIKIKTKSTKGAGSMAKIGFIGMGNMGYAMLKGVLNVFEPSDIIFTCPDLDKCKRISDETGVKYAESNAECANNAQYIVLAVKPQVYSAVMKNIVNVIREDSIVISIAPGITIDSIKDNLGINTKVVRAMPNTPALVGEGMTGVSYNKDEFSFEQRDVVDRFLIHLERLSMLMRSLWMLLYVQVEVRQHMYICLLRHLLIALSNMELREMMLIN